LTTIKAVLLAAGRGIRMGGDQPKTLTPVGGNDTLLHYILTGLRTAGVTDLLVVTGHARAPLQEAVTAEWGAENVAFIFNGRYASWGNFHSVRLAVDQSPGTDLLVVNSDVIVPPDVLRRVIAVQGDLVLAVQRRERLDPEDMRVELDNHRIVAIGKHLKMVKSHGEYAGVSLLRPAAARLYAEICTDLEWRALTTLYYEDIYANMLSRVDARAAFVLPGEYAEVDEPKDVPGAGAVVTAHAGRWTEATVPQEAPA
jgi:choline kinase